MNRRDFTRLSSIALAASHLPALAQSNTQKPIGYAAIGLGTISDTFMRACVQAKYAKITALVTGHPDTKGVKYAEMYGIPKSSIYTYETFDRIRDNKAVDAVYVGLPNSMHAEYTERAAQAGKHVLCEKPMAISAAECRRMIEACRRANVKLMIAYRCPHDPTHLEAQRILQSGTLGKLQAFESANGFNAPTTPFWRLNKKLAGGGPLMDMGIYSLNAIRFFAQEDPVEFTAVTSTMDHTTGRFAEVEQTMNWTMKFPSGVLATCATAYGANMGGFLRIHGDRDSLEISPAFAYNSNHLHDLGRLGIDLTSPPEQVTHFVIEADHFSHCIRTNTVPKTPGEEGLKDMLAIEAIYKAAGHPIA
ncbi:Gfo/Idh/MocA family oxidoreductase [Granulicella sp. WH15]|uniref:Gfo/Idh/MocA family protein n=1 Tax=Granulicella sp. WH15 TaxID=2602070 RepID=UPI001367521C|nr:Gfo/Idh/MocA family oxidoreductase [Granulicella sp. WH15]QHN02837.1 Gfo/Idh/MocA family oxidoreductase [Granulicella sp. WH15]